MGSYGMGRDPRSLVMNTGNHSVSSDELFCRDLPTTPHPRIGRVLVTGATGYIGGRLVPELVERGYTVRAMVRAASPEHQQRWPMAEIVTADALDLDSLRKALENVRAAYYLLHSMLLGSGDFEEADRQAALNFRQAAEEQGLRRIIYLGGLGDIRAPLSAHLMSRVKVAWHLRQGKVPTTILRAAIILGSGSASYEIIKHLVENLPVIPIPPWGQTKCHPIGIRDVIKYLVGALETEETTGKTFDIGGKDILTYEMMMKKLAEVLGRRRLFVRVPSANTRLFAYIATLLTPVPAPITYCLMESLRHDVVCHSTAIRQIIPFEPLSYKQAVLNAMSREEQDRIHTRWSDAYPPAHELALKLHEIEQPVSFSCTHSMLTEKSAAALFRSFCRIGGKQGWFHGNWLWRLRGILDRIVMGVGTSRGRRSVSNLRINDVIDFWRVEDLQQDEMLLLRAEMKLPGKGWLQFRIDPEGDRNRLSVTAYFQTKSLAGRAYWYACWPFHGFIFVNLIEQIEKRSSQ